MQKTVTLDHPWRARRFLILSAHGVGTIVSQPKFDVLSTWNTLIILIVTHNLAPYLWNDNLLPNLVASNHVTAWLTGALWRHLLKLGRRNHMTGESSFVNDSAWNGQVFQLSCWENLELVLLDAPYCALLSNPVDSSAVSVLVHNVSSWSGIQTRHSVWPVSHHARLAASLAFAASHLGLCWAVPENDQVNLTSQTLTAWPLICIFYILPVYPPVSSATLHSSWSF